MVIAELNDFSFLVHLVLLDPRVRHRHGQAEAQQSEVLPVLLEGLAQLLEGVLAELVMTLQDIEELDCVIGLLMPKHLVPQSFRVPAVGSLGRKHNLILRLRNVPEQILDPPLMKNI